jgi:hypothetical protein
MERDVPALFVVDKVAGKLESQQSPGDCKKT